MRSEPDFAALRAAMVEQQLTARGIRDPRVLAAAGRVPRELFVPTEAQRSAYRDEALSIGYNQTISQPYMVAATCELLGLSGGERVLDVGTGSGYAAAMLAELAAEVVTIERLPELADRARKALVAAGYERVEVRVGDGSTGVTERGPFDAIAVAAAVPRIPSSLYEQLALGGRLVLPVGTRYDQRLVLVEHTRAGPTEHRSVPCRYVPLVGTEGFPESRAAEGDARRWFGYGGRGDGGLGERDRRLDAGAR